MHHRLLIAGLVITEIRIFLQCLANTANIAVAENPETPGKFNVMSIPTFIIFKNGEPVANIVGMKSKESMKVEMDKVL